MGNRLPTLSYAASNEATQQQIRTRLQTIFAEWLRQEDTYGRDAHGTRIYRFVNTLTLKGETFRLTDIDHQDLASLFSACAREFVTDHNARTEATAHLLFLGLVWSLERKETELHIILHPRTSTTCRSISPDLAGSICVF
jgi:hypothetical protein